MCFCDSYNSRILSYESYSRNIPSENSALEPFDNRLRYLSDTASQILFDHFTNW